MEFNIWMWIILAVIIIVTIAVILILTVGSVYEERAYDKRSKEEKRKNTEKNLQMAKGHTDEESDTSHHYTEEKAHHSVKHEKVEERFKEKGK
ncbi:hypothetical protein [Staphylococcus capitis]|uniref:hypothetical protein n=1 Tax=Staphylococcus capitis TaxID=29388 RepID=UPI000BFD1D79|nr:hypothetical protein [Staphylococcus capitis]ATN01785.1 hypothetical protein CRN29_00685 [Staphylococcus capitis]MBW4836032.1 hypothetical protein [Staphylococcaceae bacterium]MBW4842870.1 hypothetical protein [Staphylococcaceae bacterium]GMX40916.1 hypothetical protein ScKU71_21460 [Streptococcus canis]